MADRGILPKVLGHRSQYGTPTYGIFMSASGVLCLCWMSFSQVVEMLNLLYCFAQLIEFAAFVQLRIKHPDMPRPFKIPLGTVGVSIILLIPSMFIFIMISFSSVLSIVSAGVMIVLGFVIAQLLTVANDSGWCVFENQFIDTCPSLINPVDRHDNNNGGVVYGSIECSGSSRSSRQTRDKDREDVRVRDRDTPDSRGETEKSSLLPNINI